MANTGKSTKGPITKSQRATLIALMLGVFMGALDISIVSPALPVIAQKLGVDGRQLPWILTLYLLVYVVSTPLMAALSDRFGRKRVFLADVAIFAVGSLWAALSPSFAHLLVARGVQALGAGGLFPIANTVIGEIFPKERRGMALGFLGMLWGVAAVIGPLAGGWITQGLGWTYIFYLNLPIALIALYYAAKNLPSDTGVHRHPLDLLGMLLLGGGLSSLTYTLNQLHSADLLKSITSAAVWPWLVTAGVLLVLFALYERFPKAPVVSMKLFRKSQLNIALALSFAGGMAEAGLAFLPFYAMVALGVGTGPAGTLILVTAITMFLFTEPMGHMVDRLGARNILLFGTFVTGLGSLLMILAHDWSGFIAYQVVLGIGLSALLGAPVRYVGLSETGAEDRAPAQGLLSLTASFGILVGTALAGAFLGSNPAGLKGFHEIFAASAAAAGVALLLSMGLRARKNPNEQATSA